MKDQQALFKALENISYEGVKIRENDEGKNNRNYSILEKCPVFSSAIAQTFYHVKHINLSKTDNYLHPFLSN